mmetsp:Transcript_11217/g.9601  ORF Transcript_11217/g.9601 Transcript_11217/m.9601 type:complete len:132 (+) Transcript_11217:659-1054(+)
MERKKKKTRASSLPKYEIDTIEEEKAEEAENKQTEEESKGESPGKSQDGESVITPNTKRRESRFYNIDDVDVKDYVPKSRYGTPPRKRTLSGNNIEKVVKEAVYERRKSRTEDFLKDVTVIKRSASISMNS